MAADRLRHLHGDLCPARRMLHTPMLDLKGFHRLGECGRPTGELHPIIEPEIPVGEPNHGDTHPVEGVGHDTDLLFHGTHPAFLGATTMLTPRPAIPLATEGDEALLGDPIPQGHPCLPEGQTVIRGGYRPRTFLK